MFNLQNILSMGEQPPEEHIGELTRQTIGLNILTMSLMLGYCPPAVLHYYAFGVALCFFHLASFGLVPKKPGWMLAMSVLRFMVILIATIWLANGHFQYALLVLSGCFSYKGIIFTHIALHMVSKVGERLWISNRSIQDTKKTGKKYYAERRIGKKSLERLDRPRDN